MYRIAVSLALIVLLTGCASTRTVSEYDPDHISWVEIKGGKFIMGDTFERSNDDALPVHTVQISSFKLSRYETSFEQYDRFARQQGLPLPMPDDSSRGRRAVSDVSWSEAMDFCASVGGRLPSESEWEYAAAGGPAKHMYAGTSDTMQVSLYVNHRENSDGVALPVGSKMPNLFGLYDMSGNVGEWIDEYYQSYPENGEEPVIADKAIYDLRIIRGGGIYSEEAVTRTYWRAGTLNGVRTPSVGFRCAKD
jgi:sulfatase modifying factor 1